MSERSHILADFFAENLGPKYGINEALEASRNPLDDYITGILVPKDSFDTDLQSESDFEDNQITLDN